MENIKAFLLAASLAAALLSTVKGVDFGVRDIESDESLWGLYERWRSEHARPSTQQWLRNTNELDNQELKLRFDIFKENVRFIHESNNKDNPYKLKLNRFADMPEEEFRRTFIGLADNDDPAALGAARSGEESSVSTKVGALPSSIDWRTKGAVTPVKDQGQCGESLH